MIQKNLFFVSRQDYYLEDRMVVEIAQGGTDYANPDMLVEKYAGEGVEYKSMTEAVKAAIVIAKAWKTDAPDEVIEIAVGCTHGNTIPFDGEEISEEVFASLLEEAEEFDNSLPKCDHCGEVLGVKRYGNDNTFHFGGEDSYPFCSAYCSERNYENWCEENKEEDEIEEDDEE